MDSDITMQRYLPLLCLFLVSLICFSPAIRAQANPEVDQLQRRAQLQQRLAELEARVGRHDPSLVENLVSLAESAGALNLHAEASASLDRAIQIQRYQHGLFSKDQIPLYFSKLQNDALSGDWDEVNEALDYLYWLLLEKQAGDVNTLIADLVRLADMHLEAVAGDTLANQAGHYREASEVMYIALNVSERLWGADDPRRVDLNYNLLKQFYLQASALERADETAYELRAVVPGSTWVRPRRSVQSGYFRAGLRLLSDIGEILSQSEEDPAEALAMVDLYRADWFLLFDMARAQVAYPQAFDTLRQAGGEPELLNRFFSEARILPAPRFYSSVDLAMAESRSPVPRAQHLPDGETDQYFQFEEWFDTTPGVAFPVMSPVLGKLNRSDHRETWLRFRVDGLNKVSRWVNGRYQTHFGVIDGYEIINGSELGVESLDARLHSLHFRPRLADGEALPTEGILLYRASVD